ncbi:MAG: DUF4157 domain-containing protein [Symploca sp. SIO3C6]|nr:DUF4157 domain-containing protein [Symploca sp. SIO3C6]
MGNQRATQTKTTEATSHRKTATIAKPSVATRTPVHPLLQLQQRIGNNAVNHFIQTKLKVGKPNDIYEQEANRVADSVMRMPTPQVQPQEEEEEALQTQPQAITPLIQQQAEEEEETAQTLQRQTDEEEEAVQMLQPQPNEEEETAQTLQTQPEEEEFQAKAVSSETPEIDHRLESQIQSVRGSGQPLAASVRTFMEPRFGYDFSSVKVHNDSQAAHFSRSLNAQAFTIGRDIFFDTGRYEPNTTSGQHLLAHELTHTVQQQPQASRMVVQRRETTPSNSPRTSAAIASPPRPSPAPSPPVTAAKSIVAVSDQTESPTSPAPGLESSATQPQADSEPPEQKTPATAKGKKEKATEAKAEKADTSQKSPTSPQQDPAFQAVVKKAKAVATQQRSHAPATVKSQQAQAAAQSPASEIESKAQANQVGEMEQAETPAFDAAAFKAALNKRIADIAPKTLKEADEFKENNQLDSIKQETTGKVKQEKAASQAPLQEKTEASPDTSSIEPKSFTPLPPADAGKKPPKLGAKQAVPKSKLPTEVEAPLQAESDSLEQQMVDADIDKQQLVNSNQPEFLTALEATQQAQTHAAQAPQAYRQLEGEQLSQAQAEAATNAQAQTQAMHGVRGQLLNQVEGEQVGTKSKDEQARAKVASDIQKIYNKTKTNVETILSDLDSKVETAFDTGAAKAQQAFEDYVDRLMKAYKRRRYGQIGGSVLWAKDKLLGLPSEVNNFYVAGRRRFLQDMDTVIDKVVTIVGKELTKAKSEITKGKQEIQDYVAKLPENLQTVGQEAAANIQSKFDNLEQSVNSKQDELISTLAQKYQENLKAVDSRIEEMKAANQGLVDKAVGAIKGVIATIGKIKAMFAEVFARISAVIGLILKDPIGFFKNLITGLKQGFNNFVSNIAKHLQAGLIMWLTGTLGPVGIQIPDDLFSLKGIFSLVTQVLGLTWDYIRKQAVKLFGEKVVAAMEKSVEIFQVIQREGPAGLWEYIKEQFSNLKEMVIDQIKDMVSVEIIKAGVKWILSLLNPVAAFIKAAMGIYNIVMFFVERAAQIADFFNSIIDAVAAIAKGAVSGAAQLVEKALAKSIPLIIGMLAALLGISGIAKKVQGIIERIRKRIDQAINKLLKKARMLFGKLAKTGKKAIARVLKFFGVKTKFKTDTGEFHSLYYKTKNGQPVLMISSTPKSIQDFLSFYVKEYGISSNSQKGKTIEDINAFIKQEVVPLSNKLSRTKKDKKPKIQQQLLEKNVILSAKLKVLLNRDQEIGILIKSYLLEGLTGTFHSIPKPVNDILTPDHQPQAAILEWSAKQPYFGKNSNMAKQAAGRASKGYAINLHEIRHGLGRTYASKGNKTKQVFIKNAKLKLKGITKNQEKRNIVVNLIKNELKADVEAMKSVLKDKNAWSDIHDLDISQKEKDNLMNTIKKNIRSGEDQLLAQDLESLKK